MEHVYDRAVALTRQPSPFQQGCSIAVSSKMKEESDRADGSAG